MPSAGSTKTNPVEVSTMSTQAPTTPDDDMPAEIDFAKGERGKFYRPGTRLALPVYLDEQVQAALTALANAKGVDLSNLVNDLLRKDIELIALGH
jgi:hypothetical protein